MAPRLDRALTYINRADSLGGFGESFIAGAGGLVLAFFAIIIGIGEAFANLLTSPVDTFSTVTSDLLLATFSAPARFMQDAWNTAAIQLGLDPWNTLGPFVAVIAAGTVVLTLMVFAWYVDSIDSDTLTGIDFPFINRDTGGDLEDEV
ncbi:hypothetical protein [Halobellus ordinarius]|uniref:hypothetical protein n=1 Tax=Halobellus ordinarius TaxID=3075120 RepID=UPI002880A0F7|nr:hypothetical protein [Halobellus sp. ZY16]